MTESQYKEYVKIQEEIKPVKELLFWCGDRYLNRISHAPYPICAIIPRRNFRIGRVGIGTMSSETYKLPKDLQDKITAVMEDWLAEKEKILEDI